MQPNDINPALNPEEQPNYQPVTPEAVSEPALNPEVEVQTGPSSADPTPVVHTPLIIQPLSENLSAMEPQVVAPPAGSADTQIPSIESDVSISPDTATVPVQTSSTLTQSLNTSTETQPAPQIIMSPQVATHVEAGTELPIARGNPDDLFGKKAKKKKIFILSGLVAFFIIAISSGFVFGFYLPNTPENVWKTGLSRTGKEVEAAAEKLSDPEAFSALSKNKITISGKVDYSDQDVTLDFNSSFDETKSDNNLDVGISSSALAEPININAKIKSSLPENSVWPNIFFNISGFSTLGLDAFYPGLNNYEGKWISVEQDFYKNLLTEAGSGNEISNITEQDLMSVMNDAVAVSQEYLFSADPEKAVINKDAYVGREESEGITAFHYKASVNEANAEKFCFALVDKLYINESYKKITEADASAIDKAIEDAKKSCSSYKKSSDEKKEGDSFDIWIDKKYKLVHKVRFNEDLEARSQALKESKAKCIESSTRFGDDGSQDAFCDYYDDLIETGERYVEIGQIYKGNEEFSFFFNQISNTNTRKDSVKGNISINIENLSLNGNIEFTDNSEESKGGAKISIKTEPFEGEIDAAKPEGAIPIQQVIEDLSSQGELSSQLGVNTEDRTAQTSNNPNSSYLQRLMNFLKLFN